MIKKGYIKDNRSFNVPYIPGENYTFYINFDKPISDPDFADFVLQIRRGDELVVDNAATLQRHFIRNISYNIYCEFIFPAIPEGCYQFVIYDKVKQIEKCRSNSIECTNDPFGVLAKVEYRNKSDLYEFQYESNVFHNIFSLPIFQVDLQFETDRKQYRNVSDRRIRNLRSFRDKVITAELYWLDDDAHEAASAMFMHSDIKFNGTYYEPKGAYEIETVVLLNIAKGRIELYVAATGSTLNVLVWSQDGFNIVSQNGFNMIQIR